VQLNRARFATSVIFFVHGLVVATWVSRIPDVQRQLGLSPGLLGTVLLAIAVGSMIAMPVAGYFAGRRGSRPVTVVTSYAVCGALAAIPLADSVLSLGLLLAVYGAVLGGMDVSMNSNGVSVEVLRRRPVMSSFHALFSLGGMAGAFLGGQVARAGISVPAHFVSMGLAAAVITALVARKLLQPEFEPRHEDAAHFALPRRGAVTLGLLAFFILICEGAMADWVAIFLETDIGAGPAMAAAGYGVFSGAMAAGRFCGDWVTEKIGPVRVVRYGASVAAVGLASSVAPGVPVAGVLASYAAVGLGLAAIIPNVFGAAGRVPGMSHGAGIAAVTTMGFFGFLIGPPLIGWVAEWTTLRSSLLLLAAFAAIGALLAGRVRPGA
jgi:MFS family permease